MYFMVKSCLLNLNGSLFFKLKNIYINWRRGVLVGEMGMIISFIISWPKIHIKKMII